MIARVRRREIHDRLPELYRRLGGDALSRYALLGESLLESLERARRRRSAAAGTVAASIRPSRDDPDVPDAALRGTPAGLRASLRELCPEPGIWPALLVTQEAPGQLRFSRTRERAVVVGFSSEDVPDPQAVDAEALRAAIEPHAPAGCALHAVWVRLPRAAIVPPLPGALLRGTILFAGGDPG